MRLCHEPFLFILLTCALSSVYVAKEKPNFLIIFADDMGYGDMSCVGHPSINTPNLDRLAGEGTRFTQWYSGAAICSPSRASMLTGRLAVRSGCMGSDWMSGVFRTGAVGGLPQSEVTLAELLKDAGYSSLAIGKWHVGQRKEFLPRAQGFDEYFGIPYSVDMGASPWAQSSPVLPLLHNENILEQPVDLSTLTRRYHEKAVEFMSGSLNSSAPFLLYLAWSHVHTPDFASEDFCKTSLRGRYGDAVEEMDHYIGKTLDALKALGGEQDTVVFFTSDNGPWLIKRWSGGSAGPFFEGKTTTWEGGIREPGIIKWPGKVPAGAISHEIVTTYDIFPTLAALTGSPLPPGVVIDGQDLSKIMTGQQTNRDSRCIMMYHGSPSVLPPSPDDPKPGLWAVRCGPHKAHFISACAVMGTFGDRRCKPPNPKESESSAFDKPVTDCEAHAAMAEVPDCEDFIAMQAQNSVWFHDPPLMFDLEKDPGEQYPLPPSSPEYKQALQTILAAKKEHEATLTNVTNQMGLGAREEFEPCCDRHSQRQFPEYPPCTCNPENWDAFVCAPVDDSPRDYWPTSSGVKRRERPLRLTMDEREQAVT